MKKPIHHFIKDWIYCLSGEQKGLHIFMFLKPITKLVLTYKMNLRAFFKDILVLLFYSLFFFYWNEVETHFSAQLIFQQTLLADHSIFTWPNRHEQDPRHGWFYKRRINGLLLEWLLKSLTYKLPIAMWTKNSRLFF